MHRLAVNKRTRLMADKGEAAPQGTAGKAGNGAQPTLNVLAQYVKDLSFESPGAPNSLRAGPYRIS